MRRVQKRKIRTLFPKTVPLTRSYVIAGGKPLVHDVLSNRWMETEKSPSDPYKVVAVKRIRRRNLRWFTKEKYIKYDGLYLNKKDRRRYKVFSRNHPNPHLRYYYHKIVTKKKRIYRDEQFVNKPYMKHVLDINYADETDLAWYEPSTTQGPMRDILINASSDDAPAILAFIADYVDELYPLEKLQKELTGRKPVYRNVTEDGEEYYFAHPYRSLYIPSVTYNPVETEDYSFDVNYDPYLRFTGSMTSFSVLEFPELRAKDLPGLANALSPFRQHLTFVYDDEDNIVRKELKAFYLSSPRSIINRESGPIQNPLWILRDHFDFTANMHVKRDFFKRVGIFDYIGYTTLLRMTHEPLRGAPDLGVLFGEMPETLKTSFNIIFLVADLCKLLKQRKFLQCYDRLKTFARGNRRFKKEFFDVAQAAIGLDFLWKFGISPLIQEIQASIALCETIGDHLDSKPIHRRFRLNHEDSLWRGERIEFTTDDTHTVVVGDYQIDCQRLFNLTGTVDFCSGGSVHIKNPVLFLLESTGLTNILGTAWELLPLSFVIDWFIRIKDLIGLLNPIDLESYYISNLYVTAIIKYDLEEILTDFVVNGYECDTGTLINTYKGTFIFRGRFNPDLLLDVNGIKDRTLTLQELAALGLANSINSSALSIPKLRTALELIVQRARS